MKRDLYVKKGGVAIPTGATTGDATILSPDAQTVAQLQQAVAALQTSVSALQTANTSLEADLAAEKVKGKGPNTEVWITESGTWTAPVTGYYEALIIGGGCGASWQEGSNKAWPGSSGDYVHKLLHFTKGATAQVTIGAGGIGASNNAPVDLSTARGGRTTFGSITTAILGETSFNGLAAASATATEAFGAGFGGGVFWGTIGDGNINGTAYGAGGGCFFNSKKGSNGTQGAIRLRYYDPNKTTTSATD